MRNSSKAATLESKFPLLAIENDCIISKDADVTVCFKVSLPELFPFLFLRLKPCL